MEPYSVLWVGDQITNVQIWKTNWNVAFAPAFFSIRGAELIFITVETCLFIYKNEPGGCFKETPGARNKKKNKKKTLQSQRCAFVLHASTLTICCGCCLHGVVTHAGVLPPARVVTSLGGQQVEWLSSTRAGGWQICVRLPLHYGIVYLRTRFPPPSA